MKQSPFSLRKRLASFTFAFTGLRILLKEEHNSRIHLFIAICVIAAGWLLKISVQEWLAITVAIGFVFSLEIVNSAIENLADFVSPEKNEKIKKIKDLSAAAVLVGVLTAVVVGLLIFVPKIVSSDLVQ